MKALIVLALVAAVSAEPPVGKYLPPSGSYGAPGAGGFGAGGSFGGGYKDGQSEPANYEFSYQVKDDYGNDFGHSEQRQGDVAKGRYYVLLPDGRTQIVEYTADENGFQPQIKYEGTASSGGYPQRGGLSGSYGAPSGGFGGASTPGGSYGAPNAQSGYSSGFAPSGNGGYQSGFSGSDGYRYK